MAVGDVASAHSSVSNGSSLTIQPGSSIEWVLHNIYYGGAMELYRTDGSNTIKIASDDLLGCLGGLCLHATNSIYYSLKNVSGGAVYMGYDGIITK